MHSDRGIVSTDRHSDFLHTITDNPNTLTRQSSGRGSIDRYLITFLVSQKFVFVYHRLKNTM